MKLLSCATNLRELSEVIGLFAVQPGKYGLDAKGCLVKKTELSSDRISLVFLRLVEQFKSLANQPGSNLIDSERCLSGLYALSFHEKSGSALKLIKKIVQKSFNPSAIQEELSKGLTFEECQKVLSILNYEKAFVQKAIGYFSNMRRVLLLDQKGKSIGLDLIKFKTSFCSDVSSIFNPSKLSSNFLVLLLRNFIRRGSFLESTDDFLSESFFDEIKELDSQGLIQDGDKECYLKLQLIDQIFKLMEVEREFSFYAESKNLIRIISQDHLGLLSRASSIAKKINELFLKLSHTSSGEGQEEFSLEETERILSVLFEYFKYQSLIEERYSIVFKQLVSKTRKVSLVKFRNFFFQPGTPLTRPKEFTYSWVLSTKNDSQREKLTKEINKSRRRGLRQRKKKHVCRLKPKCSGKPRKKGNPLRQSTDIDIPKHPVDPTELSLMRTTSVSPMSTDSIEKKGFSEHYTYADRILPYLNPDIGGVDPNQIEHGFALVVDDYVKPLGICTLWKGKDSLYSIPGEIEYGGSVYRGVYTYCFVAGSSDMCYHRCFMRKPADQLVEEYLIKGCWQFDFPELSRNTEIKTRWEKSSWDGSRVISDGSQVVEIEDPRNRALIRLFKVKD